MAKRSSSKKVARAARAGGGRRVRGVSQRSVLFPSVIAVVCVLGIALVAYAREDRRDLEEVPPKVNEDHWHAAFGVYLCDHFEPNLAEFESPRGIHTHGDGVVHIHPFSEAAAGKNATIGAFVEESGLEMSDTSIELGEKKFENGDKCGGKVGRVVLAKWDRAQDEDEDPQLITKDLLDVRFRKDGEAYTLAFLPEGDDDVPRPETSDELAELGAVDTGASVPTSSTEVPTSSTTSTTDASTTSSAEDSTTTTT